MKIILFVLTFCCFDAFAGSIEDARNQALSFGEKSNSSFKAVSNDSLKSVPGYKTDNPSETKYFDGADMSNDAKDKIRDSEEGVLLSKDILKRPKIEVSHEDSFLNQSKSINNNTDQVVSMMTGNYQECKQIVKEVPQDFEIKTCDQYEERTANSCFVGQLIKINNNQKYKCNVERKYQDKTCDKKLNLTCQKHSVCSSDKGFVNISGSNATYNYPNLTVQIPWRSGGCSLNIRKTNIVISDINLIDSFILNNVSWDDSIEIKLNGKTIFKNWWGCERATIFNRSPNLDLKKFLIEGNNIIEMKLSVSGRGFASARYTLKQKCCNSWKENWEEICTK